MQPDLVTAKHLYLLKRAAYEKILTPGNAGVPTTAVVNGLIMRAAYIDARSELDSQIPLAATTLQKDHCSLLFMFQSPDGPPLRSARIFVYKTDELISWEENSHSRHNHKASHYYTPELNGGYVWENDVAMNSYGWFLTGLPERTSLWKISRYEIDAFHHWLFTLAPVQPPFGLPILNLSQIADPLLRNELHQQYEELNGSLSRHAYRDIVTKTRNITEAVLGWALTRVGETPGRDLFDHLGKLQTLIERRSSPISDLSYHLAHKIRLLHARTHMKPEGRLLAPDLAFTSIQDLKEILLDLNLVAKN